MKKIMVAFAFAAVCLSAGFSIDGGLTFGSAQSIGGPDLDSSDAIAAAFAVDVIDGAPIAALHAGCGGIPVSWYTKSGNDEIKGCIPVPFVGLEGGYAVPLGSGMVSLPLSLLIRCSFPSANSGTVDGTCSVLARTGVAARIRSMSIGAGVSLDTLTMGYSGEVKTIADRLCADWYFGAQWKIW